MRSNKKHIRLDPLMQHAGGNVIMTGPITKTLDHSWFPADGGGLDEGKLEKDTYYYGFIIKKTIWKRIKDWFARRDTPITDFLFSDSLESPRIPSGYTNKRRIRGAIRTDSNSDVMAFMQVNGEFKAEEET